MSSTYAEQVLTGLGMLKINDAYVNIARRRRSVRIMARDEFKQQENYDIDSDLENNNVPIIDIDIDERVQPEKEFTLDRENIHFQRAQKDFTYIVQNEYSVRRKKGAYDCIGCCCKLTPSEIARGEMGCGAECLNRIMCIECDTSCMLGKLCSNQRFQRFQNASCTVFITENKGFGLFASIEIPKDTFIMEFVGEVVSMTAFMKRSKEYAKQKIRHCYVMTAAGNNLIDATKKGNLTRFLNHSCDPNAETQKWTVKGECLIGIFSKRTIKAFEEITINYQFERFGKDAQKCYCESSNCSGWIGS